MAFVVGLMSGTTLDGGGTKTDLIWFDEKGKILKRVTGRVTNLNGLSNEQVSEHLNQLVEELCEGNPEFSLVEKVFGGFAGGSHPHVQEKLQSILTECLPISVEIKISHDGINTLWSGTDGKPGLVLIAGEQDPLYMV